MYAGRNSKDNEKKFCTFVAISFSLPFHLTCTLAICSFMWRPSGHFPVCFPSSFLSVALQTAGWRGDETPLFFFFVSKPTPSAWLLAAFVV